MNVNAQPQAAHRDCDACLEWRNHIERAREARKQYRQDADAKWSDDYCVRSVDLQKVTLIPTMPGCKTAVFVSRVVAFNKTFALVGKHSKAKRKHLVVAWHEATAGRKAEETAAAYLTALKYDRNVKHAMYWLDKCAGQNRNWCLFTLLSCLINSSKIEVDDVTLTLH